MSVNSSMRFCIWSISACKPLTFAFGSLCNAAAICCCFDSYNCPNSFGGTMLKCSLSCNNLSATPFSYDVTSFAESSLILFRTSIASCTDCRPRLKSASLMTPMSCKVSSLTWSKKPSFMSDEALLILSKSSSSFSLLLPSLPSLPPLPSVTWSVLLLPSLGFLIAKSVVFGGVPLLPPLFPLPPLPALPVLTAWSPVWFWFVLLFGFMPCFCASLYILMLSMFWLFSLIVCVTAAKNTLSSVSKTASLLPKYISLILAASSSLIFALRASGFNVLPTSSFRLKSSFSRIRNFINKAVVSNGGISPKLS